ncbi:ferritin-like fold-containing protein [Bailinhaonella thermotolerans]|uniref:Hydroxylase n=1 Tax=Bailinhaonella thermotolerans TaxID=1070861 RepID=A0A3A4B572_9ACTN|nr:ferritin-like fold-containing protein [Bailinhaonella thermotolerans]RJL33487.1 hydroxylase [Bailinhaonella thermotolerans]
MSESSPAGTPAEERAGATATGAVAELLGVLAYGELAAFFQLSEDARLAPTLGDRAALAGVAAAEYAHFRLLRDRLVSLGVDPDAAMAPYAEAVDGFHRLTAPSDWLEALVKAYVGTGIAGDFYREAARHLDGDTAKLVDEVLADEDRAEFVVERVRAAVDADPSAAGRLALWARRLVGEALSQAQRVAAERPDLAGLLVDAAAEAGVSDLAEIGRMFARLTESHGKRMALLSLS